MIQSMTGYGKASRTLDDHKITVELKTLNSKQMDINMRLPSLYREHEIELRNRLNKALTHGKLDCTITLEENIDRSAANINIATLKHYGDQIATAAKATGIPMPENLMDVLLHMPDVLQNTLTDVSESEWQCVLQTVDDALERLISFRTQEGIALNNMFREKLDNISALLKQVEPLEQERIEHIRARIQENLKQLPDVEVDHNRLEQEIIFYLEKLDINEEKVRLRNHIKYFAETMDNEVTPGKKLGFIAQEMGREINTLGSKSNHSEMQILVVKMKDQLEQIKEQVLNVL